MKNIITYIIAIVLLFTAPLAATEKLVLDNNTKKISVGLHMKILEDKTGTLSLDDVTSSKMENNFIYCNSVSPSFGFTRSVYWVKFFLTSTSEKDTIWQLELDYPLMDKIDLYEGRGQNEYQVKKYGYIFPFSNRDIRHRNFVFNLEIPRQTTISYYLRFENEDRMEIPLTLWSHDAFHEKDHVEQYILGIFYGILLVMFLYNLFIFVTIKDNAYLYYILYIAGYLFFQSTQNGLANEYLWPDFLSTHYIPLSIAIPMVFILQFSQTILNTKKNAIRLHKTLTVFKFLITVPVPAQFVIGYANSIQLTIFILIPSLLLMLFTGAYCFYLKYRPAYFFMTAWSVFIIGGIVYALKAMSLLPNNYFTSYAIQAGSAFEVILLSIALGDRINTMNREKNEAQREVITMQRTYSESLEKEVYERTQELMVEQSKLKFQYESMEKEIALARKIQEQLIPSDDPSDFISSLYKPMEQVGGDFYDFITFENSGKIGIFVSDVSGHGVPAAFITSMVKTIILQAGTKKENPSELLLYINEVLQNQTAGNFITAFYCIYNPAQNTIEYSNAGHYQPYIITHNTVYQLQGGKNTAIAMFPRNMLTKQITQYKNYEEILPADSKLLLYTDGLIEARPLNNQDLFFELI